MKPIGEILRNARNKKSLSIEEVSKVTKIRKKYLLSLEESAWNKLPGVAYVTGFVKRYAEAVDLDPEKVAVVFRREFIYQQQQELLPESYNNPPLNRSGFVLTIKRIISKLIG
jgi:cytoskeletal protein RodZ